MTILGVFSAKPDGTFSPTAGTQATVPVTVDTRDGPLDVFRNEFKADIDSSWLPLAIEPAFRLASHSATAHGVLQRATPEQRHDLLRQLTFRQDYLDRYIAHLEQPAQQQELVGWLAALNDTFETEALLEHLSIDSWQRIVAWRAAANATIQGAFDSAFGSPTEIGERIRCRLVFDDVKAALAKGKDGFANLPSPATGLLDGVALRLALSDGGSALNQLLTRASDADFRSIVTRLGHELGAQSAAVVFGALTSSALARLEALLASERAPLEKRLGGEGVVKKQLATLSDTSIAESVLSQFARENLEAISGKLMPTPGDLAWLEKTKDAILAQDSPALYALLQDAGPRRFWMLWNETAKMAMPLKPAQYFATLHTKPGQEFWRVDWMYGRQDERIAAEQLRSAAPRLLAAALGGAESGLSAKLVGAVDDMAARGASLLVRLRKEFWGSDGTSLIGGTTTSYDPSRYGSGDFTPNYMRMGKIGDREVAVMIYREPPFYSAALKAGYFDCMLPLTNDIVLSPGFIGALLKGEARGVSPWQFFMVRTDRSGKPVFEKGTGDKRTVGTRT